MKHFIVYDRTTGTVLRSGICQDDDLTAQAREGEAVLEATGEAVVVAEVNLVPVRDALLVKIDAEAEAIRTRFITPGAGQAMTYLRKEAEARAYAADPTTAVPFLTVEAAATGTTVADLAAEVIAQANAWAVIGPQIEGARLAAKKAVKGATNIADMHQAATVDWAAAVNVGG